MENSAGSEKNDARSMFGPSDSMIVSPKTERRTPHIGVSPFVNGYAARIYGTTLKQHYSDAAACYRAQVLARKLHGYDDTPAYGWADWGGWEFGGDIHWPTDYRESAPSTGRSPVEKTADVDRLADPDPRTAGMFAPAREFNRILKREGLPVKIRGGSPTSVAASIVGKERILRWYLTEPDAVRAVYDKAVRFILAAARDTVSEFGTDASVSISTPLDANNLIGPDVFGEFALPCIKRIVEGISALGVTSFKVHLCGDHRKNLPLWASLPWPETTFFSIGSDPGIAEAAEAFGYRFKIGGNVDTILLAAGRYEDVYKASKRCIEEGKDLPAGFVLMPACEMPVLAPPLNVQALVDAAAEYNGTERRAR